MTSPDPIPGHVVADVVFAPVRTMGPSQLICLCGEDVEAASPELLERAWAAHRNDVRAERNQHRSSLGPRTGLDFAARR